MGFVPDHNSSRKLEYFYLFPLMLKIYVVVLIIVFMSAFSGTGDCVAASRLADGRDVIFLDNFPPNVYGVTLSRTVFQAGVSGSEPLVRVWALSSPDLKNDLLAYEYAVSAGRIVGATRKRVLDQKLLLFEVDRNGSEVVWDLSGVAPGEYTLTAGVDDGCGICGQTATQTLTILPAGIEGKELPEPCSPDVKIVSSRGFARRNETIQFLLVSNARYERLPRLTWSSSGGHVVSGQASPMVKIGVENHAKKTMSLTVLGDNSESNTTCKFEAGLILQLKKR